DRLRAVVDATNALEPDLIVLLGDYVINGVVGGTIIPIGPIAEELRRLQAPLGTVAILGNHDWWTDGPAIVAALEGAGITVLENRALRLERPGGAVWLAGIADDTTRAPDVPGTLAQVTDAGPVIVLAHDPASFADVPARPVVTLSGHTHGGQIFLPLLGAPMVPGRAPRRWAYGHIVEAGRDLIVSAGIGTSILPIRINMPPEIVVVEFGPAGR
ncbi:MAG TPA: metallophosphoesterase, partial [Alphaproteobacteria bacterium]|nr:metallophosphoesterase [Alphaproteobacteria bacterium]